MDGDREIEAPSGWTTTTAAARALGKGVRTVRRYVEEGLLEGRTRQEGRRKVMEISIESVQRMRDRLSLEISLNREAAGAARDGEEVVGDPDAAGSVSRAITDLFIRHENVVEERGALKERLAISERAESTRQAELEEIRRRELEAEERARSAEAEATRLREELERERTRSFWSKLFGSEE